MDRTAAFYAQELFDRQAMMLDEAGCAQQAAGRPDRVDFVADVAETFRSR